MPKEWTKEEKLEFAKYLHQLRKEQLEKQKIPEKREKQDTSPPFFLPSMPRLGRQAQTSEVRPPTDSESDSDLQDDLDFQEILDIGEDLVHAYHELDLPPQSMTVFLPLGQTYDDVIRAEQYSPEWRKHMELYLRSLRKVIKYLDKEGYEMDAHLQLLKEYANHLYNYTPLQHMTAAQNRKLLALSAKLKERGRSKVANNVLKVIASPYPMAEPEDFENEYHPDFDADSNPKDDPIEYYEYLLITEDYDAAREFRQNSVPHLRDEMDEAAQRIFAITKITKLHRFGMKLLQQGNQKGAYKVRRAVDDLLQALPFDDQQQIVVLLVPDDMDLPEAFKTHKNKSQDIINNKMKDMMNRLQPGCPTAAITYRILKLADKLDEKNNIRAADKLTQWLKTAQHPENEEALQRRFSPDELEEGLAWMDEVDLHPEEEKLRDWNEFRKKRHEEQLRRIRPEDIETYTPQPKAPPKEDLSEEEKLQRWNEFRAKQRGQQAGLKKINKRALSEGVPTKVKEIADAIRRDQPGTSDMVAYRMAWETYCSYTNPSHSGCTEKGKSKRESPKPYEQAASLKVKKLKRQATFTQDDIEDFNDRKQNRRDYPPTYPDTVLSLIANVPSGQATLDDFDVVAQDLSPAEAKQLKEDLVDYIIDKFFLDHRRGYATGQSVDITSDNWKERYKKWISGNAPDPWRGFDITQNTEFDRLVQEELKARFGDAPTESAESEEKGGPLPGEDSTDWFNRIMSEGF